MILHYQGVMQHDLTGDSDSD